MARTISLWLALWLTLAGSALAAAEPPDLAGNWAGPLKAGPADLTLVFILTHGTDGAYAGQAYCPEQGTPKFPVTEVSLADGKVRLAVAALRGSFAGSLNAEGMEIVGEWTQGPFTLPLVLKRVAEAPTLRRPQEPRPPYPYTAHAVTYAASEAGVTLAGTLTLPPGTGPFPAVLLLTGSGPQDRDESLAGHRPFLVLADALTRRGIAVLRVDDRGVGGSTGQANAADYATMAADALRGVAYLRGRPEIDRARVGLIGHSEGGIIAPMAAARSRDVAFLVLLAGPGVPGAELLLTQKGDIEGAMGVPATETTTQTALLRETFAMIRASKDEATLLPQLRARWREALSKLPAEQQRAIGDQEAYIAAGLGSLLSPPMRSLITCDPAQALRAVRCPVLALNGEKDLQVRARENLAGIAAALRTGKNRHVTIQALPGLNHLFQRCTTGLPTEYATIEETMAPDALQTIGDWVMAQTACPAPSHHTRNRWLTLFGAGVLAWALQS